MGHYASEMGDPRDFQREKTHAEAVKRLAKRGCEATFCEYVEDLRREAEKMPLTLKHRQLIEAICRLYLGD